MREDATIMQSDGKVASDSFLPNLSDLARHLWLLRYVHDNPQLSKFELVRQRMADSIGVKKGWIRHISIIWIILTPLSKGATTATRQNI